METKKCILLVEDEAIIALDEIGRLKGHGYAVEHVLSGELALELMRERGSGIDLVLMDINLGSGMDGPQAARLILEEHDVPVVFLSSHTDRAIVERTESITSYGYVVKGSGITVLDASIKMAFKLHDAHRDIEAINRKLEASGRMVDGIIERVSDGFVAFDRDMNYTYVNKLGARLLGRDASSLVGRNYWAEYPEARGTPFADAYARALKTQEPVLFEDYYQPWDRWFENRVYPSEAGLTVFFTEISDRKRRQLDTENNEQRFRALAEESAIGLYTVADGRFQYVNPAMASIFGYRQSDMAGMPALDIIPESRKAEAAGIIERCMAGNEPFLVWSAMTGLRKNGDSVEFRAIARLASLDGKPTLVGCLLEE